MVRPITPPHTEHGAPFQFCVRVTRVSAFAIISKNSTVYGVIWSRKYGFQQRKQLRSQNVVALSVSVAAASFFFSSFLFMLPVSQDFHL